MGCSVSAARSWSPRPSWRWPSRRLLAAEAKSFHGTNKSDQVKGTPRNDKFKAKGGNDQFKGMAGNDTAFGGDGNDVFTMGPGADKAYGEDR